MMAILYTIHISLLVIFLITLQAAGQPLTISHQGVLMSGDGEPIGDGQFSFIFRIYDDALSGDDLWSETQTVEVVNGIFNVQLGIVEPLDLNFDTQYWLGISIDGRNELQPRIQLSSVPHAFRAQSVPDGSITTAKLADEAITQKKIHPDVSLPISGEAGGDLIGTYPDPEIAHGVVTSEKIASNAVTGSELADGAVSNVHVSSNAAITTDKLSGSVFNISDNALGDLAAISEVGTPHITDSAVTTSKIADNAITTSKLIDQSVTQEKLHPEISLPISGDAGGDLTGTYPNPTIAQGSVNTSKLADNAVTTPKLGNNAITSEKIANGAVTASKLPSNIDITTTGSIEAGAFMGDGSQLTGIQVDEIALPFSGETSIPQLDGPAFLIRNTGAGTAIRGEATATGGTGFGVYGRANSTTGLGVYGLAIASSGINYGVYGQSFSTSGRGVYGFASATSGTTYGVYGQAHSPEGTGVYGEAPVIAIAGTATESATDATGVLGVVTSAGLRVYGVHGRTNSSAGRGVYGLATASGGQAAVGVYGRSNSEHGRGVYGVADAVDGTGVGVYGVAVSPNGWAGWFQGPLRVTGTITKGGGSFEIDHPLNPETMILRHSFIESPDMMNVYNGNIVTDTAGEAVVQLPDYFEALNKDFRYQLTVIGEFAQVIIAEEIINNRFVIHSDKPNVKVSWQVTGIRKDRWAEENRIVVEEYKSPELHGFYLHPVVFGLPDTRSIEWGRDPEGMKHLYDVSNEAEFEQRITDIRRSIERNRPMHNDPRH